MSSGKNTNKLSLEDLPPEIQQQLTVQINTLVFENMQLTRLNWQLVRMMGGTTEIPPTEIPMLWYLKKEVGSTPDTLKLTSVELPHPSQETIEAAANWLKGTKKDIRAAMIEYELGLYPTPYIDRRLADYVMEHPVEGWISTKDFIEKTAHTRN